MFSNLGPTVSNCPSWEDFHHVERVGNRGVLSATRVLATKIGRNASDSRADQCGRPRWYAYCPCRFDECLQALEGLTPLGFFARYSLLKQLPKWTGSAGDAMPS